MAKKPIEVRGYLVGHDMERASKGKLPLTVTIWNKPTSDKIAREEVCLTLEKEDKRGKGKRAKGRSAGD